MIDRTLPRSEILRKKKDIQTLFQNGKKHFGKHLRLYFLKAENRAVAFLVPKKAGHAVKRNRIRRLMREAYRLHKQEVGNIHILLIANPMIEKPTFQNIENDFLNLLQKME